MKIGLDIDGVVANFQQAMIDRLRGTEFEVFMPKHWTDWTTYDNGDKEAFLRAFGTIETDPNFWLSIPKYGDAVFNFTPSVYITKRPISSFVTKAWLRSVGLPWAPVVTVTRTEEKLDWIRNINATLLNGPMVFVEDFADTAVMLNKAGIKCFLLNRPWNLDEEAPGVERIDLLSQLDDAAFEWLKAA
jgi:uncharacterized HAD superfamily protein